ncbi:MAG: hypothetical protein J7L47_05320 [Candidatus Odinarchaeota archaeon]|nr:hypothetical protein [Candidatus Odinarchaeota archaeon]
MKISIIYDGIRVPKALSLLIRSLNPSDVHLITVPSLDFILPTGIHISPSFTSLISDLSPKKYRRSYHIFKLLDDINFIPYPKRMTDFELALNLSLTIWTEIGQTLLTFYLRIIEALKINYTILPLVNVPPHVYIETTNGSMDPLSFLRLRKPPEIKDIKINNLQTAIVDDTKKALSESDKILLYHLNPVSFVILQSIGSLKKIIENFKGLILYALPSKVSPAEGAILKKLGYLKNIHGLIDFTHEQIDAIIFDEKRTSVVESTSIYNLTLLPTSYNHKTKNGIDKFLDEMLRILQYSKG